MFDFRLFPGTNFNRINLDWIFSKLKELQEGQDTVTEAAAEATAAAADATEAATNAVEAAADAVAAIDTVTETAEDAQTRAAAAEVSAARAEASASSAGTAAAAAQQTATNAGTAAAAAQQTADNATSAAATAQQTATAAGTAAAAAQQAAAAAQETADDCVKFEEQTLTDSQKAQARTNIGAAAVVAPNYVVRQVTKTNDGVAADGASQFYFPVSEFGSNGVCIGFAGYAFNASVSSKYLELYRMYWQKDGNNNRFWLGAHNAYNGAQDVTCSCFAVFIE